MDEPLPGEDQDGTEEELDESEPGEEEGHNLAIGGEEPGYDADIENQQQDSETNDDHQFPPMYQPRQPIRGDVIQFWDQTIDDWVVARIMNKVQRHRHYYNLQHEDGSTSGLYCLPPTETEVKLWSLLEQEDWNPRPIENLLHDPNSIPSRNITPAGTPERQEYYPQVEPQGTLELELQAEQTLQEGRVHVLPHHLPTAHQVHDREQQHLQHPAEYDETQTFQIDGATVNCKEYYSRVRKVAKNLSSKEFPPHRDEDRWSHACLIVRSEYYTKHTSAFHKMKSAFPWGGKKK